MNPVISHDSALRAFNKLHGNGVDSRRGYWIMDMN